MGPLGQSVLRVVQLIVQPGKRGIDLVQRVIVAVKVLIFLVIVVSSVLERSWGD